MNTDGLNSTDIREDKHNIGRTDRTKKNSTALPRRGLQFVKRFSYNTSLAYV